MRSYNYVRFDFLWLGYVKVMIAQNGKECGKINSFRDVFFLIHVHECHRISH